MVFSLQKPFNATDSLLPEHNMIDWGYIRDGAAMKPKWDSQKNINNVNIILKATLRRCKCKKTPCDPIKKRCACRRTEPPSSCSTLCSCSSACLNQKTREPVTDETQDDIDVDEANEADEDDVNEDDDSDSEGDTNDSDFGYEEEDEEQRPPVDNAFSDGNIFDHLFDDFNEDDTDIDLDDEYLMNTYT